jgi:hypothetical protein
MKSKETHAQLDADELIQVADEMHCVDKVTLESLEERYHNPKTSLFRIDTL